MSFLQRNEYLLSEIKYYHEQICDRLSSDVWSENYRELWETICLQLNWHGHHQDNKSPMAMINNFLGHTRIDRVWPFESPILNGGVALSKTESIACKTLLDFQVFINGLDSWEPLAYGVLGMSQTLLMLRLIPYVEQFIEVGAKTGYYSFMAAQQGMPVLALEPSPTEYALLDSGKELNGFFNLRAMRCSFGETVDGGTIYLENGNSPRALMLSDYRATGSLIKLAVPGLELSLLRGAGDWLEGYDAPTILVDTGIDQLANHKNGYQIVTSELEKLGYSIYALNDRLVDGSQLLTPLGGRTVSKPTSVYLAMPPMAKDLAEPLDRVVDMRVFTSTAKLEALHHFVKNSFEGLTE